MKSLITICVLFLFGCNNKSDAIKFSILNQNGKLTKISDLTNPDELIGYKELLKSSDFRKLSLTQSNKDNLIVEQKDEDGYLVLVNISHEQFVIETPLKTLDEVLKMMCNYIEEKDKIIERTKFY